ncbi:hypothetical protein pb186bvf_016758 [Paramecium bursaria]
MSIQDQIDLRQDQIEEFQKKYREKSASPKSETNRKRIKSGTTSVRSMNFKVNPQNFFKQSKDQQGGGVYTRQQIMGSSLPTIKNTSQALKQTPDTKRKVDDLQLQSIDSIEGIKQVLGPQHHCHFEVQLKHIVQKLEQSEELAQRARDELDKVIWMVKNYNSEGLISKLLDLQKLKNDLEQDRQQMKQEIELLGLQRDDWQQKYEEIKLELLKMQGMQDELESAQHKLQMQTESLEKINKRLREKQIEVQDWQRKCNTHDEQYKLRINNLESTLKEQDQEISKLLKKCQIFDKENQHLQNDIKQKNEKLEDEQRKTKQLHAELLDIRVNRVQNLQDEITKQKKVIQQRVEEIEENEKKIKTLNTKIQLLETQLKNFDETAKQEKEEIEKSWTKKYKELEKQNVQLKRDINLLEIQIQQNDLLVQQKEQEAEQSLLRANQIQKELDDTKKIVEDLKVEINRLNIEVSEKDQQLEQQDNENEYLNQEIEQLKTKVTQLEDEISELRKQINQQKRELELSNSQIQDLETQIRRLNEQIYMANQNTQREKELLEIEIRKNDQLNKEIQNLNDEIYKIKDEIKVTNQQHEKLIEKKDSLIKQLQGQVEDFKNQDKDLNQKLESLEKDKADLNAKNWEWSDKYDLLLEQLKQSNLQIEKLQGLLDQKQKEISDFQAKIHDIQNDKSQEQRYNSQIEGLNQLNNELKQQLEEYRQEIDAKKELNEKLLLLQTQNKEQQIQIAQLQKEIQQLQDQLQKKENEFKAYKAKAQNEIDDLKDLNQKEQNAHLLLNTQNTKKIQLLNDELQQALDKIEMLEEAIQNSKGKDFKVIPKQQTVPLHRNNSFQQIFVEEKGFNNEEKHITLRFQDINLKQAHLTICFWIKIQKAKSNLSEQLPILRINASGKKLLEMGVYLDTKQIYATYIPNNHPQNKKASNPITVSSQLAIQFDKYQLLALVMTESGVFMDMGLSLNGIRDDQVSISSTLLFPEAELVFGRFSNHETQLKDALVITQNITTTNVFKEVFNHFNKRYNNIKQDKHAKREIQYSSAGDLIFYILQQNETNNLKSKSKSKSPMQQEAIVVNDRIVPAGLLGQYDLGQDKNEEDVKPEPEPIPWSRKIAVEKLKKFLYSNFQYKTLLKPFVDRFDYISQGLQYLQPARMDENNAPTKFHSKVKPSLQNYPFYVIPYSQLIIYLNFVGLMRINEDEFKQLLNDLEIIFEYNKQQYVYYDHLLIVIRECVMNRAELKALKDKLQPPYEGPQYTNIQVYTKISVKQQEQNKNKIPFDKELDQIQHLQVIIRQQEDLQLSFLIITRQSGSQIENPNFNSQDIDNLRIRFSESQTIVQIESDQQKLILSSKPPIDDIYYDIQLYKESIQDFEYLINEINFVTHRVETLEIEQPPYDPDQELEDMQLPQLIDGWNTGRFYININRCRNCDKHQATTRHLETDFIQKAEHVTQLLKEQFPNVEIVENEDKLTKLESFEVYIKNAVGKGKITLLSKQENMAKFLLNFDKKLPELYERLVQIINFQQTTEQLGLEQDKLK